MCCEIETFPQHTFSSCWTSAPISVTGVDIFQPSLLRQRHASLSLETTNWGDIFVQASYFLFFRGPVCFSSSCGCVCRSFPLPEIPHVDMMVVVVVVVVVVVGLCSSCAKAAALRDNRSLGPGTIFRSHTTPICGVD